MLIDTRENLENILEYPINWDEVKPDQDNYKDILDKMHKWMNNDKQSNSNSCNIPDICLARI